ncbi:hypothetical protein LEP1GSC016_3659 [Leptospira borgpetersenii serovar Hardjo-bovis str. Sponselee]|uniref:Uncharacterized protein n=2 Tax=Leptospira borgpetersenii TaxID=174 RepID=M6BUP4_LEPBO|nr:hypothetical protein LEP1GSC016_3659 [Leptospira borgpetersenii serovar Hardjo-bovis str. Sponselee]EMO61548.1 hypothetical protein LEP1GSC133_3259 [Leptospira borgpetersenii serovar Pomona str. 200901868]
MLRTQVAFAFSAKKTKRVSSISGFPRKNLDHLKPNSFLVLGCP